MTFRFQDLKRLIDTHGVEITFTTRGSVSYDPSTGNTSSTDTNYTVYGYFYNYNLSELGNNNINLGDRKLVLSLVDTSGVAIPEPEVDDIFSGEGDTVRAVSVSKIMSGGPICYICQVRE